MPAELELKVPTMGESITEVLIGRWHKSPGERVKKDEGIVELESDKATVDLPAPADGTLAKQLKPSGESAKVGEVIGFVAETAHGAPPAGPSAPAAGSAAPASPTVAIEKKRGQTAIGSVQAAAGQAAPPAAAPVATVPVPVPPGHSGPVRIMPAAERALAEKGVRADDVRPTGPGGRLLKEDVLQAERAPAATLPPAPKPESRAPSPAAPPAERAAVTLPAVSSRFAREEEYVAMSPIRRRIAQRLVEAQQNAALLTTFNEIDMAEVMALRQKHKDAYQQRYGVKLGFMSFFVKATIDALKLIPQVNAEIREPHIVYRNYYDIGIAVGGGKGLVVPVLRNAEFMSFGEIELAIADFARRAQDNKLKLEELQGGTFTISNGGVYGSLLSTPIVNPPQSGILGLHAIQDRPVARNGQVVIRPMMYTALTYDHRLVDGREAVTFLKRIKDTIEDPARILLEV